MNLPAKESKPGKPGSMFSMAYWRLHYHLIWATYRRLPLIDGDRAQVIDNVIRAKARELRLVLHALGHVEDHVHVVISIPPTMPIAECIRHLKGASSRAANRRPPDPAFKWQEGYGALTIGERSLPKVIAYATNQAEHHRAGTVIPLYERSTDIGPLSTESA